MNRISINLKRGNSVVIADDDDTPQDELLENLSTLFSVNNVAILKTKDTSVIIRPSDISSVEVKSMDTPVEEKPLPPKVEPKIVEDIVTDMD